TAAPPEKPAALYQEKGARISRALPYRLHCTLSRGQEHVGLCFENQGTKGAVYHVYDLLHLDRIPRRYTVEAGKALDDRWDTIADSGAYDLEVFGPNGYFHKFRGRL